MTATGTAGEGGEHEHTSRWPLVTAVGANGLYVGAGLALVGPDLVPVVLPAVLVGGGSSPNRRSVSSGESTAIVGAPHVVRSS